MSGAYIKDYHPSSWLTMIGVRRKRAEIIKKGVPDLKGCLFFTLTIDPENGTQSETYDLGKDRLRRFLEFLRLYWGEKSTEHVFDDEGNGLLRRDGAPKTRTRIERYSFGWAWKLEFQENGYAHWHVLVKTNKLIARRDLHQLNEQWGLGRTNVKRIKKADFDYLFKYVSKCPAYSSGDSGLALPDWVLDYKREGKNGRPQMRIRFWQTRSFYEPPEEPPEDGGIDFKDEKPDQFGTDYFLGDHDLEELPDDSAQTYSLVRYTIREFSGLCDRVGLLVVEKGNSIKFSAKIYFDESWVKSRQALINEAVKKRKIMEFGKYPIFEDIIYKQAKIWHLKLNQILSQTQSALVTV